MDFHSGTVDRNPPANAGDMGSIPCLGRFHTLQSNQARVPQPLSLRSTAHKLQLLSPAPRACALQQEKPQQWEASTPQQSSPLSTARESPRTAAKTQRSQSKKKVGGNHKYKRDRQLRELRSRFFKNLDTPKIKRQRKDERKMMSKSSLKESWCDYIDIR